MISDLSKLTLEDIYKNSYLTVSEKISFEKVIEQNLGHLGLFHQMASIVASQGDFEDQIEKLDDKLFDARAEARHLEEDNGTLRYERDELQKTLEDINKAICDTEFDDEAFEIINKILNDR